ncbi:ribosome maturation factor RimM [Paenibacillus oryzae]|uniref:Ribosome maturation factor RimM n=1 Tax=Paenibacillus oryzae TaxID=1844972 RepID=A0A1A5YB46_9BACL|nr:ribosome maturation factor RimM [Paenibacillus oryzae]OBR62851.1 ribosome maturation factor RimM [Paenibacillus oryzae]
MKGNWYRVGKVVNSHGIRGDIKVLPQTDFPEERFATGSKLLMVNEESGESLEVTVASARLHKNVYVMKLQGYSNINEVERFKGWSLKISEAAQGELEEGQYYYHQIIGCRVVTDEGAELGEIVDILSPGANDVWVVETAGTGKGKAKQILLPVIDEVVLKVEPKERLVTVALMEGLI